MVLHEAALEVEVNMVDSAVVVVSVVAVAAVWEVAVWAQASEKSRGT